VHQADGLDGAERLVVEPDAARIVDEPVHGLQHGDRPAVAAENVRQHQTGGSRADDDDLARRSVVHGLCLHGGYPTGRRTPRSIDPSHGSENAWKGVPAPLPSRCPRSPPPPIYQTIAGGPSISSMCIG